MHPALTIAQRAALSAGKILLRHLDRLDRLEVVTKQRNDFVSEADIQAEQEIIRILRKSYPDHSILAEERGRDCGTDEEHQWIIDPLDGTINYLHGLPHFAVSIALQYKDRLEVGVIYDPLRQELFTASRGRGAQLNDRRIRVKTPIGLEGTLLGTGFPFHMREHLHTDLGIYASFFDRGAQMRHAGSATLDLAYVAAGRLDGFWEMGLSQWDMAAGALLIQEAGGLVGDFNGGHQFLETGNIVAGNPKIFKAMVQTIQLHLTPGLRGN